MKKRCKNPNHNSHVANIIKKYPSAKGRVPKTIIMVNPNDWAADLEPTALNTTESCHVRSIAEGITLAEKGIGPTGLEQVCACNGTGIKNSLYCRNSIS